MFNVIGTNQLLPDALSGNGLKYLFSSFPMTVGGAFIGSFYISVMSLEWE